MLPGRARWPWSEREEVEFGKVKSCIPLLVVLLAFMPAQPVDAGEDQELLYSLGYSFQHRLQENLRYSLGSTYEQKYAAGDFFGSQNEFDLYGGLTHDLQDRIRIEAGLGYYFIHRDEAANSQELRLWQTGTFDWPESPGVVRRFVLHHRFQLEERFRGTEDEWSFALRFRYRLAYVFPINRYTVEPGAWFTPIKAEFYFPLGDDLDEFFTQQIRFTVGIGYVLDTIWRMELRYAWQHSRDTRSQNLELGNHYLEFRVSTAVHIQDLLKAR